MIVAVKCGVFAAELEGVKLDMLIMNKNIESKMSACMDVRVKDAEIIQLKKALFNEKERCKQLEDDLATLIRGRNQEINELNNTIVLFENKIKSTKASNESLSDTIMCINSVKISKTKQYGVPPSFNQSSDYDQINCDCIEVKETVHDNTKDVCLNLNKKPDSVNEENGKRSGRTIANEQAGEQINTILKASMHSNKCFDGVFSKVLCSNEIIHNASDPNPNPRPLRLNPTWINSLPLIDTSMRTPLSCSILITLTELILINMLVVRSIIYIKLHGNTLH